MRVGTIILPPAIPALPEVIPAPIPKMLLPGRPGNLLSGVGCQLEIITNATAARNEAMMILRIEGSRDETRTPDSMLPARSDSSNFLTRCHCTFVHIGISGRCGGENNTAQ